ncbi:DUF4296 domain-containing protein [Soonwooa sp.]|uniref:DUF4296 domain-containing protein n=2 Tax=Soonwooa sp. TaxID=1938592 RepID=UPI0028ADC65C|nr:DUF4296 domain-containing protein [Soonwooa sp.]
MKKWSFLILFVLMACSKLMDKPKNLIPQDQMAEIMADFAINDQSYIFNQKDNREGATKFLLKKYKITSKDFSESYSYYVATNQLDAIVEQSKEYLFKKEPKLEDYIKKKEQANLPPEKTN